MFLTFLAHLQSQLANTVVMTLKIKMDTKYEEIYTALKFTQTYIFKFLDTFFFGWK
jgi:hypothetical protein